MSEIYKRLSEIVCELHTKNSCTGVTNYGEALIEITALAFDIKQNISEEALKQTAKEYKSRERDNETFINEMLNIKYGISTRHELMSISDFLFCARQAVIAVGQVRDKYYPTSEYLQETIEVLFELRADEQKNRCED